MDREFANVNIVLFFLLFGRVDLVIWLVSLQLLLSFEVAEPISEVRNSPGALPAVDHVNN